MKNKKILIVDDDYNVAYCFKIVLEELGLFNVDLVYDGISAIKTYVEAKNNDSEYHLVFMDYNMPGVNGEQVLYFLKDFDPNIKAILHSSTHFPANKVREMGFIDKIDKLESINKLRQVIFG